MNKQISPEMLVTSRRTFLASTAAFTVALSVAADDGFVADAFAAETTAPVNIWVSIAKDGTISIASPASELGQGSFTSIPLILAEELDADWSKVKIVQPPEWDAKKYGNPEYGGNLSTSSSFAVRGYFTPMRLAGAQARRILMNAAAEKWNVPASDLTTEPSVVVNTKTGKRLSYGEIAAFAKPPAELPKIEIADLKPTSQFRLIGKDVDRVDVPAKSNGCAKYAMDVQVPGMIYAAIVQPPYDDATLADVDETAARAVSGISDVVRLPDPYGVAVLGNSVEATQAAKKRLVVKWNTAPRGSYDSEKMHETFAAQAKDLGIPAVPYSTTGDIKVGMKGANKIVRADYRTRYLYHAQMEPLSATVLVSADKKSAEVWAGTQSPSGLFFEVGKALEIPPTSIKLNQHFLGGGFGRRSQQEVVIQAGLLSKQSGKPVKVVWSREDDIAYGKFRPMTAHHMEAALDKNGKLVAWHHRVAAEAVGAYMASARGLPPPQQDVAGMKGTPIPQYNIPNKLAEHVVMPRNARISSWRGVGNGINGFVVESFMDEVAKVTGKDPLAIRLELAEGQPRVINILNAVAEMADWKRKREGRGLGLALMNKDDTLSAGVAEVSLERDTGLLKIHSLWLAIDSGIAVQPRNLAAQTEGSSIYCIGSVLRERIVIKDGKVQQGNFDTYLVGRMSDAPHIEVKVMSTDNRPTGGGEHGLPLIACAVGNAVAQLTGVRLRELPFSSATVKAALEA